MVRNARPVSGPDVSEALDALPDAVIIFAAVRDTDGVVVDLEYRFTNTAALQLFDQEVVGHTHLELYPSIREGELWPAYVRVIETGEPASVDVMGFDDHGLRGDFVVNAARFDDGLIVTVRDVGDRQRLLEQIQEERESLRHERDFIAATLSIVSVYVVVVDNDWRIVRFNRECERVTGYREFNA